LVPQFPQKAVPGASFSPQPGQNDVSGAGADSGAGAGVGAGAGASGCQGVA